MARIVDLQKGTGLTVSQSNRYYLLSGTHLKDCLAAGNNQFNEPNQLQKISVHICKISFCHQHRVITVSRF